MKNSQGDCATEYPLCAKLGLQPSQVTTSDGSSTLGEYVPAGALERVLASAPVVFGCQTIEKDSLKRLRDWQDDGTTHQARLLMVEPIVKDSAEGLIAEIVERYKHWTQAPKDFDDLFERAKKLVQR